MGAQLAEHGRRGGAATTVDLTDSPQPVGGYVITLQGAWHGPALYLANLDNVFTELFTARGAISAIAHPGTAHTTIRYGSEGDFTAACAQLEG